MLERRDPKITDLERRLSNQIVIGKISQIDHKRARYRVKFGAIETDWLPDTQSRSGRTKVWEGRDIGEQVIISSPCGDLAQGVILGSIHTDATQAGDNGAHHRVIYPDGTVLDYDDESHAYSLSVAQGGSFELIIGGGVSLKAQGGQLTINAPEGILMQSGGNVVIKSPDLIHNAKSVGDKHRHLDVVAGPDLTGVPVG